MPAAVYKNNNLHSQPSPRRSGARRAPRATHDARGGRGTLLLREASRGVTGERDASAGARGAVGGRRGARVAPLLLLLLPDRLEAPRVLHLREGRGVSD